MRGRTRLLLVALFAALFALVPAPDEATGRPYLAYLSVRSWLLDGTASPLAAWQRAGHRAELQVTLQQSPPIEDDVVRRQREAEYARIAAEWPAATAPAGTVPPGTPVPMLVRVGTFGVHVELMGPDGGVRTYQAPFASRWSLLPAALAIGCAVLFGNVLLALLLACLGGGIAYVGTSLAASSLGPGSIVLQGAEHFVADALWRRSLCGDFYLTITLFVVFLFMTIGVVTANGGVHGLVALLQRRVRGPVSAQLCAYATGLLIFFDDYSNCLIAGTTMRPLCDAARVSREKLAWIVDSTAAPVAGLSIFSTWITYEISQYSAPLAMVTRPDGTLYTADDAYGVFLATLPYRFYCWFTLAMVFLVIVLRRDFGPMLAAERRARQLGQALAPGARPLAGGDATVAAPAPGTPRRARNAALPLAVLVFGTVALMLWNGLSAQPPASVTGFAATVRFVLANADSVQSMLWAAAAAYALAVALSLGQRLLLPSALLRTSLRALRGLVPAFGVLFLAWSLGHLCSDLGTSHFLTAGARGAMAAAALPLVLFGTASLVSFATGTSFGTMAILLPNVVVLAHQLGTDSAFGGSAAIGGTALMLVSIGAVLEGAILGDHCSPISDTTVLSSLGSQCDLLGHVQTQLPYALLVCAVSAGCGYLPVVLLGPDWWWLSFGLGLAVLATVIRWVGRRPESAP